MSLTITNDSVLSVSHDTESVEILKYGNDKVWPNKSYGSLMFSADAPCSLHQVTHC